MTRQNKFIAITAIVAVVALGVAAALYFAFGAYNADSIMVVDEAKSFSPSRINGINVRTSSTDIRVTPSETGQIEVKLSGEVRGSNPASVPTLALDTDGGVLEVRMERNDGGTFTIGFVSMSLILEIAVPGALDPMILRTSSGDITISELSLEGVEIGTSSGSIDLKSIQTIAGRAVFESSSGDIDLDIVQLDGDMRLDSSSGEITVGLPADAGFELAADTSSGDINVEFPMTVSGSLDNRDKVTGTVGAGTHRLSAETSSGDILIRRR
jgi:lia operon protein LiaG